MTVSVPSLPNDIIKMIMEINTNRIKKEKKEHFTKKLNDIYTKRIKRYNDMVTIEKIPGFRWQNW